MPNKTIYVSDSDLSLYQRAQELADGNLSAAIAKALRRFVDVEEGRQEGFEEITVRVGVGGGRKQRFSGVLLGEWGHFNGRRVEEYKVYRTRKGKFAIHVKRSEDWRWEPESDGEGFLANWRKHLGIGEQSWGSTPKDATLEVVDTLEELRNKIPVEFYDMIAHTAEGPAVEDLDI